MNLEIWRDIAVVWLALLCFIGMVIPLVIAFFAVKGMHVAVERLPRWLGQAQRASHKMRTETVKIADRVAEPVITIDRKAAGWGRFLRSLTGNHPRPH